MSKIRPIFIAILFIPLVLSGQEIHRTASTGDIEGVCELLDAHPELLDSRDDAQRTPLICAAEAGHADLVRCLIERGADVHAGDGDDSRAIHFAAAGGHYSVIDLLLGVGVDLNEANRNGMTPLHFASAAGREGCVDFLLERGVNVNVREVNLRTPLFFAARSGRLDVCRRLINAGADVNVLNLYRRSPLLYAAWGNHLPVVDYLLEAGAQTDVVDSTGYTLLHYACMEGQADFAERLLKRGAKCDIPDGTGREAVHLAANRGYADVLAILIAEGVPAGKPDMAGDTPLHGVAWKGDMKGIELLISQGADVNARNNAGRTPLDYALLAGRSRVIEKLKDAGGVNRQMPISERGSRMEKKPVPVDRVTMTVLYDNTSAIEGVRSEWGFSCLIEGTEKTILFDTGGDGEVLMYNVRKLDVDLSKVDLIVISHNHWDHTGGLSEVLKSCPGLPVYAPSSFPYDFVQDVEKAGGRIVPVEKSKRICEAVYTTGEMGDRIIEQSLVVDHPKGSIIVTGCSHQGIVSILEKAKSMMDKEIYLVFGGFHLLQHRDDQVESIIERFRELGVQKCGATHCTGDRQIEMFREAFGREYVPIGTGRILQFSENGLE